MIKHKGESPSTDHASNIVYTLLKFAYAKQKQTN